MHPIPDRDPAAARRGRFHLKTMEDGTAMLNIACGTRMHHGWNNVDFSPYTRLAAHPGLARLLHRLGLLSQLRYQRLQQVDRSVISWDLRKGIPFPDDTFDVVYHSHFLEHLDRSAAPALLRECRRAVKPGGFIRVVVPDLQVLVAQYVQAVAALEALQADALQRYQVAVHELFDQMVRTESAGTAQQQGWMRRIEARFRTAASTGELHKWMYDRHSLAALLIDSGFREPTLRTHETSAYPRWREFGLDTNPDGSPYKKKSLYMEAFR